MPGEDELGDDDLLRYARHVILDEMGEEGQARLLRSRIAIVGAGGIGSPALLYLAAAGIGTIRLFDDDAVDRTNLQRQIAHDDAGVGRPKAESAAARARAINPAITIEPVAQRITPENAAASFDGCDLVLDGTDSHAARLLISDACRTLRIPLVSASVVRFEGQLTTLAPHLGGPCYRCLFPAEPAPGIVPRCDTAGILGPVAGVMGSLQAVEAVKQLAGIGTTMVGRLMLYDALDQTMRVIATKRDPRCPACGGD